MALELILLVFAFGLPIAANDAKPVTSASYELNVQQAEALAALLRTHTKTKIKAEVRRPTKQEDTVLLLVEAELASQRAIGEFVKVIKGEMPTIEQQKNELIERARENARRAVEGKKPIHNKRGNLL